MPYARAENLSVEEGEVIRELALTTRFTVKQMEEAARWFFAIDESPISSFRKIVTFADQVNTPPEAICALINDLAFEEGRSQ